MALKLPFLWVINKHSVCIFEDGVLMILHSLDFYYGSAIRLVTTVLLYGQML